MTPLECITSHHITKNGRIEAFDCFAPRFSRKLLSSYSICVVATLLAERKGEMFGCTVLESTVPLF
jgi:hypothetical protein